MGWWYIISERQYGKVVGFTDNDLDDLDKVLTNDRHIMRVYKKDFKDLKTSFVNKHGGTKIDACPQGTVLVDNACIKTKTMVPYLDGCPSGNWVYGRLTKGLNVITEKNQRIPIYVYLNNPKRYKITGTEHGYDVEIETVPVCIHPLPFPSDVKKLDLLLGRDTYPHWIQDADVIDDIQKMKGSLHDKKGYAVPYQEGYDKYYLLFDDKKEAEMVKETFKYWDDYYKFYEDTKKYLIEEEGSKEEITDSKIHDQMDYEKQIFWDDISLMSPSYIGIHSKHDRHGDSIVETPTGDVFPAKTKDDYEALVFVKEGDIL